MKFIIVFLLQILFAINLFSQKADTASAFTLLEKYTYGVPVSKNFSDWERKIKNDDNYTYSNKTI